MFYFFQLFKEGNLILHVNKLTWNPIDAPNDVYKIISKRLENVCNLQRKTKSIFIIRIMF